MKLFKYTAKELKALMDEALSIDNSSDYALDEALKEHSRLHAQWTAIYAQANKQYRLMEIGLETLTAQLVTEIRQRAKDKGKPLAATAPVKKEMVPTDPRWIEAQHKLIEMGEFLDILSCVEKSFNNRAWLLIRLARNREGGIEPSVKGKRRKADGPIEFDEINF